jgi:hypothetical protein
MSHALLQFTLHVRSYTIKPRKYATAGLSLSRGDLVACGLAATLMNQRVSDRPDANLSTV